VGRATVRVPEVFLLDEPLTHMDAGERIRLRTELAQLQRGLGVTAIYVTHDQSQAMAIGDRVAVMRAGRIEQVDEPRALYLRPANTFVAASACPSPAPPRGCCGAAAARSPSASGPST
jgi:multiple sugar transport system ATP-binding protein